MGKPYIFHYWDISGFAIPIKEYWGVPEFFLSTDLEEVEADATDLLSK